MANEQASDFGYIHVYTGNGKGKTTAAIGLAMRALGAQKRVLFAQFMKGRFYSECLTAERFAGQLEWVQYGTPRCVRGKPGRDDCQAAAAGLADAVQKMHSDAFDLVVLDELNVTVHMGLLSLEAALEAIDGKPKNVELVLTGRYAPKEFIDRAHVVTEMKEIKHYYTSGVQARVGIEKS